ncbi:MAG: hypothetical protein RIR00_919, partial [Pseudomonadota bacterium]
NTAPAPDAEGLKVAGNSYYLQQDYPDYTLYAQIRLFFQNGGGPCYIVSVGDYSGALKSDAFSAGLGQLTKEQEPTMIVIPEAIALPAADCLTLQQACLMHCGLTMKNRVAILDIHNGYQNRQAPSGDPVAAFRDGLGVNFLSYGMAYYPWLHTTIHSARDLGYENLTSEGRVLLQGMLESELGLAGKADTELNARQAAQRKEINKITLDDAGWTLEAKGNAEAVPTMKGLLHQALMAMSGAYVRLFEQMAADLNLLAPSGTMAGVYTMVDNSRGVWKAPANVSLAAVTAPTVSISNDEQEDLNVTPTGKSINAIRSFIGEGVLVWGARTLDGNSLDWRYINVRRTMIMLEESIRLATKAYVFEPNVANTWVTVKSMIRNFLTGIWKRGGLAGAIPEDAFSVFVGLGETMTPEDILEGILRVTVLVAITRPAEFIEITFQQQMQKS